MVKENIMNFGIVIPAQLGGKTYERNPLQPFGKKGKTLLEWKINQVKKVFSEKDIFVNSASDEVLEIAKSCGVNALKRNNTIDVEYNESWGNVIHDIVKDIDREHIVWISPTHPFMNEIDYSKAISIYENGINESTYDSLMSVFKMDDYIWIGDKAANYSADINQVSREDLAPTFKVTNGLFIREKSKILNDKYYLGDNVYKLEVDKLASQDIDSKDDVIIAESLITHYENVKRSNQSIIFLDFDGVIVDSAKEAYAMALLSTGRIKTLSELDLESDHAKRFLNQRCHIGPAWNYYYLLKAIDENKDELFSELLPNGAGKEAKKFQEHFFATRQVIRNHFWDEWLALNELYEGSRAFIDLINQNNNIVIVTTKDAPSVKALLGKYGTDREVTIYDAKAYEDFGCKSLFIDDYIKSNCIKKSLFIDDSMSHLEKCNWVENLNTIQAKWGYLPQEDYSDNKEEVIDLIVSVLNG
jgi:CMP-N-acetylneuraminic acid synthetase/phosphoglycolate phosphatase-like HAD superfamily hydrolase